MNDINELRKHLFETLAALKDKDNPMDIDRAKAVSEVSQTIISAKLEVEYAKTTGEHIDFIEGKKDAKENLPIGITNITQHRLR